MSLGELGNLYKNGELIINPEFQRLFRWDSRRKTNFIESLLLGIPIPPLFVFQGDDGNWELIDGLQRTSTILEFMGELLDADGNQRTPLKLEATSLLPALEGVTWNATTVPCLTSAQKLDLRRARIRIEILKRESDDTAKFEMFQRLNTGGVALSEQEVRNCTMVMINPRFYKWVKNLSEHESFKNATSMTDASIDKQVLPEQVLRFFSFLKVPYTTRMDVHAYLDQATISMAQDQSINLNEEEHIFYSTFDLIYNALNEKAFRRWDGTSFTGKFLQSVFEVVATGVAENLQSYQSIGKAKANAFILQRSKELWSDSVFKRYSGAGVSGRYRLSNLLPMAKSFMAPCS